MIKNIQEYGGVDAGDQGSIKNVTRFEYKNLTIELQEGQKGKEFNYENYLLITVFDTEDMIVAEEEKRRVSWIEALEIGDDKLKELFH